MSLKGQGRRSAIIAATHLLPPTGQGTLDERRRDGLSSGQSCRRPASQQRATLVSLAPHAANGPLPLAEDIARVYAQTRVPSEAVLSSRNSRIRKLLLCTRFRINCKRHFLTTLKPYTVPFWIES
jgi:hypothetical protein